MNHALIREEQSVINAAANWWESKKPQGWSEQEHLANPEVNCIGEDEERLGRVFARYRLFVEDLPSQYKGNK